MRYRFYVGRTGPIVLDAECTVMCPEAPPDAASTNIGAVDVFHAIRPLFRTRHARGVRAKVLERTVDAITTDRWAVVAGWPPGV